MTKVVCPSCAGDVWVRDLLMAESGPTGTLRLTRTRSHGPLRWTCTGCGYMDPPDGRISARLDGTAPPGRGSIAAR